MTGGLRGIYYGGKVYDRGNARCECLCMQRSCHLRGNCHPPPFNDLDGGIQILQMLPSAWAQSSSLSEHVDGRSKSEAHSELAEGEELSGGSPLGEKISGVAFAFDSKELQHTI